MRDPATSLGLQAMKAAAAALPRNPAYLLGLTARACGVAGRLNLGLHLGLGCHLNLGCRLDLGLHLRRGCHVDGGRKQGGTGGEEAPNDQV